MRKFIVCQKLRVVFVGFPLKNTALLILLWEDFFSSIIICIFIILFLWVKETFSTGQQRAGLFILFP